MTMGRYRCLDCDWCWYYNGPARAAIGVLAAWTHRWFVCPSRRRA